VTRLFVAHGLGHLAPSPQTVFFLFSFVFDGNGLGVCPPCFSGGPLLPNNTLDIFVLFPPRPFSLRLFLDWTPFLLLPRSVDTPVPGTRWVLIGVNPRMLFFCTTVRGVDGSPTPFPFLIESLFALGFDSRPPLCSPYPIYSSYGELCHPLFSVFLRVPDSPPDLRAVTSSPPWDVVFSPPVPFLVLPTSSGGG